MTGLSGYLTGRRSVGRSVAIKARTWPARQQQRTNERRASSVGVVVQAAAAWVVVARRQIEPQVDNRPTLPPHRQPARPPPAARVPRCIITQSRLTRATRCPSNKLSSGGALETSQKLGLIEKYGRTAVMRTAVLRV